MRNLHVLANQNSILKDTMIEIRDKKIQKDRKKFRDNLKKIGRILAYEISQRLDYVPHSVETPLGVKETSRLKEYPVLVTILRAGLALHEGLLDFFDKSDCAFISAYRKHHKDGTFDIELEYLASPPIDDRVVILSDPMLATGSSMVVAYNALLEKGKPRQVHLASVIGSVDGVEYSFKHLPDNTHIWLGDLDDELTAQAYIVPGLGDAGDLAYGEK